MTTRVIDSAATAITMRLTRRPSLQRYRALVSSQIKASLYTPLWRPPVSALLVGSDNSIWLRRPDLGPCWQILSPGGISLGTARIPDNLRLVAIGKSTLLAVRNSNAGVKGSAFLLKVAK